MPSALASATAASTIRSRLSAGFGPLVGRARNPQAASRLAGRGGPPPEVPSALEALSAPEAPSAPEARSEPGGPSGFELPSGSLARGIGLCISYAVMFMPYAIEATGLRKDFAGTTVLAGGDLPLRPRGVFSLLGPHGAGKTTPARLLCTPLRPPRGTARGARAHRLAH